MEIQSNRRENFETCYIIISYKLKYLPLDRISELVYKNVKNLIKKGRVIL